MQPVEINKIKEKLDHIALPREIAAVYVYGSFVKGRLREDSDVDIALLASYDVDDVSRLELMSKLEAIITVLMRESGFKQEVSILDLRGKYVSVGLQYKVVTEGVLVYERDITQRMEFENSVKREHFDFQPYLRILRKQKYGDLLQKV